MKDVKVDLAKGEATFQNPQQVSREEVRRAVEEAGFGRGVGKEAS